MTNARSAKSAREKAAQMRAEADRKAARRRVVVAGTAVLAVILVAIGATIGIRSLQQQQRDRAAAAAAPPANVHAGTGSVGGGLLVGKADAKVTVDIYSDYLCPACKAFEAANGPMLQEYADDGRIALVLHPVAILDRRSSTQYSTRAGNAVATVINSRPDVALAYHDLLFANQPGEDGAGLSDGALTELAVRAGADRAAVEAGINEQRFAGWVTAKTEEFTKAFPPGGTPTVVVNGKALDDFAPATITAAIEAAEKA